MITWNNSEHKALCNVGYVNKNSNVQNRKLKLKFFQTKLIKVGFPLQSKKRTNLDWKKMLTKTRDLQFYPTHLTNIKLPSESWITFPAFRENPNVSCSESFVKVVLHHWVIVNISIENLLKMENTDFKSKVNRKNISKFSM